MHRWHWSQRLGLIHSLSKKHLLQFNENQYYHFHHRKQRWRDMEVKALILISMPAANNIRGNIKWCSSVITWSNGILVFHKVMAHRKRTNLVPPKGSISTLASGLPLSFYFLFHWPRHDPLGSILDFEIFIWDWLGGNFDGMATGSICRTVDKAGLAEATVWIVKADIERAAK